MNILIVAPDQQGIDQNEIPIIASGNRPTILSGMVTAAHLEAVLAMHKFSVIHFMQHGAYGMLKFSDGPMNEDQLVRALRPQAPNLRLVFVNACNSAGVAARLHNELRCATIAHEAPIDDRLAVVYAREFYKALGGKLGYHEADSAAFAALETEAKMLGVTDYVKPILTNGDMTTLQNLSAAVDELRSEQEQMRNEVHRFMTWARAVLLSCVGFASLLVSLAYFAPH